MAEAMKMASDMIVDYYSFPSKIGSMPWEEMIQGVARSSGLPPDQFKYTVALLSGIPIGMLFRVITSDPWPMKEEAKARAIAFRHCMCAAVGFFLIVLVFGWEIFHTFFSSTVAFILMRIVPRSQVHIWVSIWAMGYMSGAHAYRMLVDYGGWTIDFTTPQLLVTQKMMNIAFALYDSSRDPAKLSKEQTQRQLSAPPSPIEFMGYVFCLHTLLAGPSTDYNDYLTWIDGSRRHGNRYPVRWAVLAKIGFAVYSVVMFLVLLPKLDVSLMGEKEWLEENPTWWILVANNVSMFLMRHRYYFAWVLCDAGCNAAGFGYQEVGVGEKKKQNWNAVLNVDYLAVEMATNFRSAMTGWNIAVSNWLRRCVYERAPSGAALVCAFGMSALWHGFYPGYYLTFLSSALFQEVARLLRKHIRPLVPLDNAVVAFLYHTASTILTICSLNYLAVPFVVLSLEKSFQYWSRLYFIPHIVAIALLIFLRSRKPPKTEDSAKKDL